MYARVSTATAQKGKADECIKIMRDYVLPTAKKQKGFKGALFITNQDTGKGMFITLWNTEADRTAAGASIKEQSITKLAPLCVDRGTVELYEVSLQE